MNSVDVPKSCWFPDILFVGHTSFLSAILRILIKLLKNTSIGFSKIELTSFFLAQLLETTFFRLLFFYFHKLSHWGIYALLKVILDFEYSQKKRERKFDVLENELKISLYFIHEIWLQNPHTGVISLNMQVMLQKDREL